MKYLIIQLLAVAFCWFAARSMRKHAIAYYVGAFALEALFLYGKFFSLPGFLWTPIFFAVDQCMLGTALFVVVMFVGVFPKNSPIAQRLRPSRGELSISAWILCLGHLFYLTVIPRMADIAIRLGFAMPMTVVGLIVALILLVLLIVLGVTSFKFVKRAMNATTWKAVQRWSYLFYACTYIHVMLMVVPSAVYGSGQAAFTALVYTAIFGSYAVLRVKRALAEKAEETDVAKPEVAGA